jgi:hypothetical protein
MQPVLGEIGQGIEWADWRGRDEDGLMLYSLSITRGVVCPVAPS